MLAKGTGFFSKQAHTPPQAEYKLPCLNKSRDKLKNTQNSVSNLEL